MGTVRGTAPPEGERQLVFRSAGELFCLDVDCVCEVVPPPEVTPVPFVQETVAGIANHRGAIFTLIDFARLAGLGADNPGAVVLLRLPEMAVGLLVAAVDGIERLAGGAASAAEAREVPDAPFWRTACDRGGRSLNAIDAGLLAGAIARTAEPPR